MVNHNMHSFVKIALFTGVWIAAGTAAAFGAELPVLPGKATFTKDIAPILQRSCQNCHHSSLTAYLNVIRYFVERTRL